MGEHSPTEYEHRPCDTDLEDFAVLCSERLSQMTRTYNDIEAVSRLLEEKERDLELAAKIGQTLLQKNQELCDKNETLEDTLAQLTEKLSQVKHELTRKDELLQALTHSDSDSTPSDEFRNSETLLGVGAAQLDSKVRCLEEENIKLRLETAKLSAATCDYEEKEARLISDCVEQLGRVKEEKERYADDLLRKTEENSHQKEEITSLLAQVVDLQRKVKVLTLENMELTEHLAAAQLAQRRLTNEVSEMKDKYDELVEMFEEKQRENQELRRQHKPRVAKHKYVNGPGLMSIPSDSLASELELSLRSEDSQDERSLQSWKAFETARAAKRTTKSRRYHQPNSHAQQAPGSAPSPHPSPHPSTGPHSNTSSFLTSGISGMSSSFNLSAEGSDDAASVSKRSSIFTAGTESEIAMESEAETEGYNADLDSLYNGSSRNRSRLKLGHPGIPGSNDLETALRKLSIRRANELNERDYFEDEDKRLKSRPEAPSDTTSPGTYTPDSLLSTGSGWSNLSLGGSSAASGYRLPEKLRIVKPLEGSVTLRHWQMLATPNLGGVMESRPGIKMRGEKKAGLMREKKGSVLEGAGRKKGGLEEEEEHEEEEEEKIVYNISDIEEDTEEEEVAQAQAKNFQPCPTVNTYVNSVVKQPTPITSCASSQTATKVVTSVKDRETSTFSMSLGLAALLNERDLLTPAQPPPQEESHYSMFKAVNPKRCQSIVSDSLFPSTVSKTSPQSTMASPSWPGFGGTGLGSLREMGFAGGGHGSEVTEGQGSSLSGADVQDSSLLNKIKNTGYSLYGYLGQFGQKPANPEESWTQVKQQMSPIMESESCSSDQEVKGQGVPTQVAGGSIAAHNSQEVRGHVRSSSSQEDTIHVTIGKADPSDSGNVKSGNNILTSLFRNRPDRQKVLGALSALKDNGIL